MKDKLIFFILGAAAGTATTFFFVNKKYRKMYEEDVASVKASLNKTKEPEEPAEEKPKIKLINPNDTLRKEDYANVIDYAAAVKHLEYTDEDTELGDSFEKIEAIPHQEGYVPEIVTPYTYHDNEGLDDYDAYTFYYFADGVVTDDQYDIIEDIAGTIGEDAVNHFDEWEDDPDSVYIKNDEKRAYYELVRDERVYSDVRPE